MLACLPHWAALVGRLHMTFTSDERPGVYQLVRLSSLDLTLYTKTDECFQRGSAFSFATIWAAASLSDLDMGPYTYGHRSSPSRLPNSHKHVYCSR